MSNKHLKLCVLISAAFATGCTVQAEDKNSYKDSKTQYAADGSLVLPENLEEWVFLGSSIGAGYSDIEFDPDTPGNFQIVRIEPEAYREFTETGHFPDGTIFAMDIHNASTNIPPNDSGYVMNGESVMTEYHVMDKIRFPKTGFNFFISHPGDSVAKMIDLPNDCVACHTKNAEHQNAFTQFYPATQKYINSKKTNSKGAH